jgi:hypothetical protein
MEVFMCQVILQDGDQEVVMGEYEDAHARQVAEFFCKLFEGEYEIEEVDA